MARGRHALIFGASGVTGWAFVNEMLHDYPKTGTWSQVTALSNRPLTLEDSLWPKDDRLRIVSGIDLLKGDQDDLAAAMKDKISDIDTVTHAYYFAYKGNKDVMQELKDAEAMFRRAITATDCLSPKLEFVVLQLGAKIYGCHLLEESYLVPPLREDYPRLRQPYHDQLFYHPQLDWIASYCKGKKWTWCDTRPDIIIGFTPNSNFYGLANSLGVYLSLYAHLEGKGAECPFPGSAKVWVAKTNDSSSDMIARETIYLSLHPETCGNGEGFNIADSGQWETWSNKWPQLCSYFGLRGVAPNSNSQEVRAYIKNHLFEWKQLEQKHKLRSGIADSDVPLDGFEYFLLNQLDFDRQYDMSKLKSKGFAQEIGVMEGWEPVFNRMRKAKIIP
ncbi:MAG: hypothetical protein M1827_004285 [Pycnora praestabilis]|nr:MAG: hypothetical protein M1827_004285 [Pycnora praestabilis]